MISGSCSVATCGQVGHFISTGHPAFLVDPTSLAEGDDVVGKALAWAIPLLPQGRVPLIYATASPEKVRQVQSQLGADRAGTLIEAALASIAQGLVDAGVRRLIVAGGETSGAVVTKLGVKGLCIGQQIDPGVPWTVTLGSSIPLALALKSGNFGSVDFFTKSWELLP